MPKKGHVEHANHEAWAIPYGDLVTLLLAFFVVMYSLSSVNEGKYRILSDALQAAFRGDTRTLEPIQIGEVRKGAEPREEPTMIHLPLAAPPVAPMMPAGESPERSAGSDPLDRIASQIERLIGEALPAEWVVVRRNRQWIEVEIQTDLLFQSGAAALDVRALPAIDRLAEVLQPFSNPIHVEGHTDTQPISTALFPSNWELSAARAATVVRRFETLGIESSRMTVLGLGEHRPAATNDTVEGRNRNRRVVLVVLDPGAMAAVPPGVRPDSDGVAAP